MTEPAAEFREVYSQYAVSGQLSEPLAAIAEELASGTLDRESFHAIVRARGVWESRTFRNGLLDMVLHYIHRALKDHVLSAGEHENLRYLTTVFGIKEGEFYQYRRNEIASILEGEVHRLFSDEKIDPAEALYQGELQRLFGLGYDQFLELTHAAAAPVVEKIAASFRSADGLRPDARQELERRLLALGRVYPLSSAQRRSLGL